jgi:hypothetical protein
VRQLRESCLQAALAALEDVAQLDGEQPVRQEVVEVVAALEKGHKQPVKRGVRRVITPLEGGCGNLSKRSQRKLTRPKKPPTSTVSSPATAFQRDTSCSSSAGDAASFADPVCPAALGVAAGSTLAVRASLSQAHTSKAGMNAITQRTEFLITDSFTA